MKADGIAAVVMAGPVSAIPVVWEGIVDAGDACAWGRTWWPSSPVVCDPE